MGDFQDRSGTEEADACDRLGSQTGGVKFQPDLRRNICPGRVQHIIFIECDQHTQRTADADHHVGPETRSTASQRAAVANQPGGSKSQQQPKQNTEKTEFPQRV